MVPAPFNYVAPDNLNEAVAVLKQNEDVRVLAGGHTLLREMKLRRLSPQMLVDLRKLGELRGIQMNEAGLQIGAMTTFADMAAEQRIAEQYPALADVALSLRDPQIRNRATIGGSLAYNDPVADMTAVALALSATLTIVGGGGKRKILIDDFITGAYETVLDPSEIIVSVSFPTSDVRSGSAYEKFRKPVNNDPLCGVAANVACAANGIVRECRLAVTGAAAYPQRLTRVEEALQGKELSTESITNAAKQAGIGLDFRADRYASAEYRAHLTAVFTKKALLRASAWITQ